MTTSADKLWAKPAWQKELQRVIAFSALEILYGEPSMNEAAKATRMSQIYHGNAVSGTASFIDLALTGKAQFVHLWALEDLAINQQGNEDRSKGVQLSLKDSITQELETKLIVGQAFTRALLSRAKSLQEQAILGRNLLTHANSTLKHVKKAIAFAEEFMPGGELPSGATEEDLDQHVLMCMYKILKGKTSFPEGEGNNNDVSVVVPTVATPPEACTQQDTGGGVGGVVVGTNAALPLQPSNTSGNQPSPQQSTPLMQ